MKKLISVLVLAWMGICATQAAKSYDNPDTIVVAQDGSGEFQTISEAVEVCRAFMEYHKVIYIKKGVYCEKLVIPSWLTNIELCGEDAETTILTHNDHANMVYPNTKMKLSTFRTYTLKIEGSDITIKNLTIENNAPRRGQAVALHTEGDRIKLVNCRLLGHQDTVYTGVGNTRIVFNGCYIEGTTDFIFGPSTAWFEKCHIHSKSNSYITAASTPKGIKWGYVFNQCKLTADEGVTKVYLGRPWRPYAYTLFMQCELGKHIVPAGWKEWSNKENVTTTTYAEYKNYGPGANTDKRVEWSRQLTDKEAKQVTIEEVMNQWDDALAL